MDMPNKTGKSPHDLNPTERTTVISEKLQAGEKVFPREERAN